MNVTLPQEIGAAGEVELPALPSCARSKVAGHFFVGRSCPSPREGLIRLVENDTSKMINRRKTKCGLNSSDYWYSNLELCAGRDI